MTEVIAPPCSAPLYMQIYLAHAGKDTPYHNWYVRQARALMAVHRRHCPYCRDDGARTNYNLREPRRISHRIGR